RAGLSARGISDLERGVRRTPQRETVRLLAEALGLSEAERLDLEEFVERRRGAALVPAMPSDVPPSGTVNLPIPSTPLVGRQRETAAVRELLHDLGARLVTLTGAGGVGKTRIALRVAEELSGAFTQGVHFIPLSSIAEPTLLASEIAHALGVSETSGQGPEEALAEYLRGRQVLLVLDNFEHLLDGAPLVARLLTLSPGLRVLVTSRALLRLTGEHEFPVPPLELPAEGWVADVRALARSEAISLFVQRARAARPTFELTANNATAVSGICRRLDGLPLAIELAAARIRILPPEAMLGRIDHSLALLTGGARDLPERQRTLSAAIDWSYDLLDEKEKTLFARLAVFAGGWTLEAAEAVCDPEGGLDVMDGMESLVEQSLIRLSGDHGAEPRFRMHATMREYALLRLERCGEAEDVRRRHAEYYTNLADRAGPELEGANQGEWLERLEREHDNLRAGLSWLLDREEGENVLRAATAVWRFWDMRGHYSEGQLWLERGLAAREGVPVRVRASALTAAGYLAWMQGNYPEAVKLLEGSLTLRRELGDPADTAFTLNNLGLVALDRGEQDRAKEILEENFALRRETADTMGMAVALNNLSYAALLREDYEGVIGYAEESKALFSTLDNSWGISLALSNLGRAALELGDLDRAGPILVKCLGRASALGERRIIAECLEALAAVAGYQGAVERAARLYGAAEALREQISAPLSPAERAHQRKHVDALRAQIGRDQLDAVRAAGRSMTLEDAIETARDLTAHQP
ncbi:MAG: tetratricopeptide repeat protein, partial [Chloroflexota bacterium]|nr:tetratricopeptide repeat protein [Chloroflexota bacterium]